MKRSLLPLLALASAVPFAGCGGGDGGGAGAAAARPVLGGSGYTADQLEQALLTELPGYRRGEPETGEYGALKSVQHFGQLQRQVKVDRPACAKAARPGGGLDPQTPASIATFTKDNGVSVTETLLSLPDEQARKLVGERVPAGCRTFRTTVGAQTAEHRVTEPAPGTIGEGSRTVGVTTTSGNSHTKTWYVVLRGRRTVTTISLYGPVATQRDAEDAARRAYDHQRRFLS
ncbi:hypothetical protein [Actinomadura atramentaria]|uniref:hypothetical protein n=1 Tax=Actinomadura atramentaria TaxID=1990 RepID=UPI00036DE732|nr:hypothetical protein [Actinomadura atramentaria]